MRSRVLGSFATMTSCRDSGQGIRRIDLKTAIKTKRLSNSIQKLHSRPPQSERPSLSRDSPTSASNAAKEVPANNHQNQCWPNEKGLPVSVNKFTKVPVIAWLTLQSREDRSVRVEAVTPLEVKVYKEDDVIATLPAAPGWFTVWTWEDCDGSTITDYGDFQTCLSKLRPYCLGYDYPGSGFSAEHWQKEVELYEEGQRQQKDWDKQVELSHAKYKVLE